MIENSPFENACGTIWLRHNLKTQLGRLHRLERRGVECVLGNSKSLRLRNRDELVAIPVEDSATLRSLKSGPRTAGYRTRTRVIDRPIELHLVDLDRLAPLILHPARAFS